MWDAIYVISHALCSVTKFTWLKSRGWDKDGILLALYVYVDNSDR